MIETFKLTKRYGNFEAVAGIDLQIGRGEVVGFLGPNGAGKTTTMRMLTTFLPPSSGTAKIAGFDILRQGAEVRRRIGYLPETPPLYPELRVGEYLEFVGQIRDLRGAELKRRIGEVLAQCSLSDVERKLCGELSKGFRQRVGLAQALLHLPEVIILDEPTSGLDPAQIIGIRRLIHELKDRHTVLLSTHILPEVAQVCSRVVIIAEGRIAADGSVEELTAGKSLEHRFLEVISTESIQNVGV